MGNKPPLPPPPPSPVPQPWRRISKRGQRVTWDEEMEKALHDECMKYDRELGGKQVRILMFGPSGSGKSSFINSVYAALTDQMKDYTFAARASDKSVTKTIFNPHLRVDKEEPYFRILDAPGLMETTDMNFFQKFFEEALKGRLKEDVEYRLDQTPNEGKDFVEKPGNLDRPCLVVFVMKPAHMEDGRIKDKLEMVKDLAGRQKIKVNVVLTMADSASQDEEYLLKNENAQYIFHSKAILEAVNNASSWTGIPQNRIFPVTNYTEQTETCTEMNIVLLYTLSKLLGNAKQEADSRLAEEEGGGQN